LISYLEIQPFIVSLAGLFFAKGLPTIVSAAPRTAEQAAFVALKQFRIVFQSFGSYGKNGNFIPAKIELGVLVALAIVLLISAMLKWTRFGRNLYAIGGNSQSAMMLGINVKRTRFFSYLLCGLLSGIGGYVYLLHTGAGNVSNATASEMQAIASSIIGGTLLSGGVGHLIGSPVGALSLLTINELIRASGVNSNFQSIASGLLLCIFIVLQSVVLWLRGAGGFKLALPAWLLPRKKGA